MTAKIDNMRDLIDNVQDALDRFQVLWEERAEHVGNAAAELTDAVRRIEDRVEDLRPTPRRRRA